MTKAIDVYQTPRTDRPSLKKKHIRQFDREFLIPTATLPSMSVLEIGCGTGIFLRYLKAKGFTDVVAFDTDAGLAPVLDDLDGYEIHLENCDNYLSNAPDERFDRIVLFDVAEHFPVADLLSLMRNLHRVLKLGGHIVIRSPNCGSPWGLKMQYDTFDHITPITRGRLQEMAQATGFTLSASFGGEVGGSSLRKILEKGLHGLLNRMLTYHPDIWEATIVGVLTKTSS